MNTSHVNTAVYFLIHGKKLQQTEAQKSPLFKSNLGWVIYLILDQPTTQQPNNPTHPSAKNLVPPTHQPNNQQWEGT